MIKKTNTRKPISMESMDSAIAGLKGRRQGGKGREGIGTTPVTNPLTRRREEREEGATKKETTQVSHQGNRYHVFSTNDPIGDSPPLIADSPSTRFSITPSCPSGSQVQHAQRSMLQTAFPTGLKREALAGVRMHVEQYWDRADASNSTQFNSIYPSAVAEGHDL